jgi:pilus assembly protein CpaF
VSLDAGLVERVRGRLAADPGAGPVSPARLAEALRAEGRVLGDADLLAVLAAIAPELGGLGPLQGLLNDERVSDVLVNGPDEVWLEVAGALVRSTITFRDDAAVRALAQRLAASAGRRVDDAVPFADVRLAGGVRLHVALSTVATRGTCLSLRVGRRQPMSAQDLVTAGSLPPDGIGLLERLVRARCSVLVTGGTGSGKTTVLGTLLGLVPPTERIVVAEDSGELAPQHPHVVLLEARPPNLEGAGAITLRDLLRQALRMRPDRLVVGEVRGPEVVDLLAAFNTGHDGGFGTVHANAAADLPARLEALARPAGLDRAAVHAQVAAGVDAVVHLERDRSGRRRVVEVGEPRVGPEGVIRVEPVVDLRGGEVRWLDEACALGARLAQP